MNKILKFSSFVFFTFIMMFSEQSCLSKLKRSFLQTSDDIDINSLTSESNVEVANDVPEDEMSKMLKYNYSNINSPSDSTKID
jgi:hypothetical protein